MQDSALCPCGSQQCFDECCGRHHAGHPAATPAALMRSRYSAYVRGRLDYLRDTTLPAQQSGLDLDAIGAWSRDSLWLGLQVEDSQILDKRHARVQFVVDWQDASGQPHRHREDSLFVRSERRWFFFDPTVTLPRPQRNAPCLCGSGQKFKRCCAPYC